MSENAEFSFTPDAIGHVLADRVLAVPVYQRSFSWTETEVEEFLQDLMGAFRDDQAEYFIGNLVLSKEGSDSHALAIIDGQQRLATTSLLVAAIREQYHDRGDQAVADSIHGQFISIFDRRRREEIPRLKLNSDDDPFFRRLIVDRADPAKLEVLHSSHQLILDAFQILQAQFRDVAEGAGDDWADILADWTDFLETKVRVVVVDVPTEADAFLIFETLNDRGADLTIADLLKNYLFRRAADDLDLVRDAWMNALGALEISAENSVFTTFLRHLWSSTHGATRERLLYKSIKERITTRVQAVEFAQELKVSARLYAAILNSDHDFWRSLGASAKENIETLERLRLEQGRPLLLAIMQHFTHDQLRASLRALVAWGVRGLIVGGIGGGKTERVYCDAALKVRSGEVKNAAELLRVLAEIVPSDDEFRASFARARVTTGRLARYYLHAMERTQRGEEEPELIPNQDAEQVNLEHVLPKNPGDGEWDQFSAEEHSIFVHRIGNMVLLRRGENDRLGNKPWEEKKPVLEASDLVLTQRAGEKQEWTGAVIDALQNEMSAIALRTWPREP